MAFLEVTSLSTKGQIVIPQGIREKLGLESGAKLIVIQEGDSILLKPIKFPKKEQFKKLISLGDKVREKLDLTEDNVKKAVENVRKEKHENSH
ncbi:MAG: hypothetical protein DRP57_09445 [Spirochaetes bacterium]|nr:MAG: hypothetical protein DRP57_09445 [Spirochaetota bacterium]